MYVYVYLETRTMQLTVNYLLILALQLGKLFSLIRYCKILRLIKFSARLFRPFFWSFNGLNERSRETKLEISKISD